MKCIAPFRYLEVFEDFSAVCCPGWTTKEAYCQGMRIWVDGKYGQIRLPNSWEYGSHAPASELFNRSVEQVVGYGYKGNFYVEDER